MSPIDAAKDSTMTTCVMVIRCHHGTSAAKSGSSSRRRARMLSSIDSPSRSGWPSSRLPPAAGGASPNGLDVVGVVGAAPNGLAGGAAPNGLAGGAAPNGLAGGASPNGLAGVVVDDEDDDVVSVSAPNGLLNASSDVALSSEAASSESRSGAAELCSFAFACSLSFDSGEGSSADDVSSASLCASPRSDASWLDLPRSVFPRSSSRSLLSKRATLEAVSRYFPCGPACDPPTFPGEACPSFLDDDDDDAANVRNSRDLL
mmetsp:Transcript_1748/g.3936  ORF Transcript_1748/g.3936 Transcript_1748/m.3936 type:complete len:260 (-) Transcript_1748:141-920(-)